MRRHTWTLTAVASALVVSGCNDPTTGGNVANGDQTNQAWHSPDPRDAGRLNPTGSDSGPWIGEAGLNDSTTGINDRLPRSGSSAGSMAVPPKAEWGTRESGPKTFDELSAPSTPAARPTPTAETAGPDRR